MSQATWCFLTDLDDVRSFAKESWTEYLQGRISFLAASTITDTAFGLLRCADEDFLKEESGSSSTNWEDLVAYLGLAYFYRGETLWLFPATQGNAPKLPHSNVNMVELLCPIGFMCLKSFNCEASEFCLASYANEPLPTGRDCTCSECSHDFSCVLSKLTEAIHAISHTHICEHIVLDEFVQGKRHPRCMIFHSSCSISCGNVSGAMKCFQSLRHPT